MEKTEKNAPVISKSKLVTNNPLVLVALQTGLDDDSNKKYKTITVDYQTLEHYVFRVSTLFDDVEGFMAHHTWEQAKEVGELQKTINYAIQSYEVHFETGTPVKVSASVYHEEKSLLSEEEIITEAKGYVVEFCGFSPEVEYSIHVLQIKDE